MPKYIAKIDGTFAILHSTAGEAWLDAPDFFDPKDVGAKGPSNPLGLPRWVPYGVAPREQRPADQPQWPADLISPSCPYDIDEIAAYAQAHPEDAVETFSNLEEAKREALERFRSASWTAQRFNVGVITWEGMRCQINPGVQAKLLEYQTSIANGRPGPFLFHDADNANHQLSPAQVLSLAAAVQAEVDCIWAELFDIKARIRAATNADELKKIAPHPHQHRAPAVSAA